MQTQWRFPRTEMVENRICIAADNKVIPKLFFFHFVSWSAANLMKKKTNWKIEKKCAKDEFEKVAQG